MPQLDNSSPITLTGPGQQLTLTQPGQGSIPNAKDPSWAVLQNDSNLVLYWLTGADSGAIQAWTAAVVQVGSAAGAGYGIATIAVTTMGNGSGSLSVIWSNDGDPIPPGYPSTTGATPGPLPSSTFAFFGVPVASAAGLQASYSISLTGVISGNPIIFTHFCATDNPPGASPITDTFPTNYIWTKVQSVTSFGLVTMYIGTGGAGASGTITFITGESGQDTQGVAVPLISASTAAGLAAIDASSSASGDSTNPAGPSLTSSAAGDIAVYAMYSAGASTDISIHPPVPFFWAPLGVDAPSTNFWLGLEINLGGAKTVDPLFVTPSQFWAIVGALIFAG